MPKWNQYWYGVFPEFIKPRKENNFWYSLPLEKVRFLNKKLRLFRLSNFKIRSF